MKILTPSVVTGRKQNLCSKIVCVCIIVFFPEVGREKELSVKEMTDVRTPDRRRFEIQS